MTRTRPPSRASNIMRAHRRWGERASSSLTVGDVVHRLGGRHVGAARPNRLSTSHTLARCGVAATQIGDAPWVCESPSWRSSRRSRRSRVTVAFTSLSFRDDLSGELGLGLAAMFIGMLLTATVVGVRSGLPGHVVSPQDGGLVVLSVVAPTIATTADAPGETIVVLMGLSSIAVGLAMVALGRSGLGRMIRYLPYPVLAGFLAGTGLVMAQGTYALASRGIGGDATGGGDRVARFAVVITVAFLMTAISRSSLPNERFVPPVVVGSIAAYHVVAVVAGIGRTEGAGRGWLLPELPAGHSSTPARSPS